MGLCLELLDWNIDWSNEMGYRIFLENVESFFQSNTKLCRVAIYLVTRP